MTANPPPVSPVAEPPPDPRVLTEDELTRVARVRAAWTWYGDAHAADDVRFLLGLVDRLTGATPVPPDPLPVPGGRAPRATPAATAPAREPGDPLRSSQPAGVALDEEAGLATLLGRLDGLRAELAVLLEDARTRHRLPWTLVNAGLEGVDTATYFLAHHDPGEETP